MYICIQTHLHIYTHTTHPIYTTCHTLHNLFWSEFWVKVMFNVFFFTLYFQQRLLLLYPAANECELYLTSFFLILYFFLHLYLFMYMYLCSIFVFVFVFLFYICTAHGREKGENYTDLTSSFLLSSRSRWSPRSLLDRQSVFVFVFYHYWYLLSISVFVLSEFLALILARFWSP